MKAESVDLGWVKRAAESIRELDHVMSETDALDLARALAFRPAWQVCDARAVVEATFRREGRFAGPPA